MELLESNMELLEQYKKKSNNIAILDIDKSGLNQLRNVFHKQLVDTADNALTTDDISK